jgi:membrane protein DedA with SNARE-associated domain
MKSFQRHGLMAVFIPSILPPPSPFKIFVLLAGVADIGVGRFAATIAIGRGIRYLALGLLAVRYGDEAFAFIEAHEREAAVALVILIAAALAGYLVWTRAESRKSREDRLS